MKRLMLTLVFVLFFAGACGPNTNEPAPTAPEPSLSSPSSSSPSSPSPTPTPSAFEMPVLESLIIAPGGVGPLEVGMSKNQALATKLTELQPETDDGCEMPELRWHASFQDALDLWLDESGVVVSIGIYQPGPHTIDGLGVGSTLADIQKIYPKAKVVRAGEGQAGIFVSESSQWMGFLFNSPPKDVNRKSIVAFAEVTGAKKPSLIRIGC